MYVYRCICICCKCISIATAACNGSSNPLFCYKRLSASVAPRKAFCFHPVLCSARLPARAEPWRRSQSVPGAFYQCTEDAGVFNEYVKHGVMAE